MQAEDNINKSSLSNKSLSNIDSSKGSSLEKFKQMAAEHQQKKAEALVKLNEESGGQAQVLLTSGRTGIGHANSSNAVADYRSNGDVAHSVKEIKAEWKRFKKLEDTTRKLIDEERVKLARKVFFGD